MTAHKRIGILTSGGDCAGLNAAIRAVVHRAIDAHRGLVFLDSGASGTRFTIVLPRALPAPLGDPMPALSIDSVFT